LKEISFANKIPNKNEKIEKRVVLDLQESYNSNKVQDISK
jgi:hypothetical protein